MLVEGLTKDLIVDFSVLFEQAEEAEYTAYTRDPFQQDASNFIELHERLKKHEFFCLLNANQYFRRALVVFRRNTIFSLLDYNTSAYELDRALWPKAAFPDLTQIKASNDPIELIRQQYMTPLRCDAHIYIPDTHFGPPSAEAHAAAKPLIDPYITPPMDLEMLLLGILARGLRDYLCLLKDGYEHLIAPTKKEIATVEKKISDFSDLLEQESALIGNVSEEFKQELEKLKKVIHGRLVRPSRRLYLLNKHHDKAEREFLIRFLGTQLYKYFGQFEQSRTAIQHGGGILGYGHFVRGSSDNAYPRLKDNHILVRASRWNVPAALIRHLLDMVGEDTDERRIRNILKTQEAGLSARQAQYLDY